jgi:hypothetical protein
MMAILLLVWLVVAVPIFLRMPLTNDAELFDLQARMLGAGKVLYRDILEPNLPGVIWIHSAVRMIAGQSSEALRAFDLLVFAGLLTLSFRWLRSAGVSTRGATATLLAISVFYLSASEWNHCQRDMWMLTVSVVAASLRIRNVLQAPASTAGTIWRRGLVEGLVWGCGIWIKPYVVLVAIACWIATVRRWPTLRQALVDGSGVLAGGVIAGAAGLGWMLSTGCFEPFIEQSREWNPHYFAARMAQWDAERFIKMSIRFFPWMLLHPIALLISLSRLKWALRLSETSDLERGNGDLRSSVLAAVYLAWCVHIFLLQHLFDYVHTPGVVLAILVTADWIGRRQTTGITGVLCYGFALTTLLSPYLRTERLADWRPALTQPGSPELRDQLQCFDNPSHQDMAQIVAFLQKRGVEDGDVLCFNSDFVSLYRQLEFFPPTRFIYVSQNVAYVPTSADTILDSISQSGHRFVVTDLHTAGLVLPSPDGVCPSGELPQPMRIAGSKGVYPWGLPIVFRAGWYLVYEVSEPSTVMHIVGQPLSAAVEAARLSQ